MALPQIGRSRCEVGLDATAAHDMVAALRVEAGRHPSDADLTGLVGELCTRSEEFATLWASQNVRFHRSGLKDLHHPAVGDLRLEAMDLPADPGLSLVVYSAEPGSSSDDGLRLLATWAATQDSPQEPPDTSGVQADVDR